MAVGTGQILLALAAAAQAAGAAPEAAIWYTIVADDGDVLGFASREIVPGPDGREVIDSSEVRLQELGDPARRVVELTVTRQDSTGRAVSIVEHSQMGPAWSRVEARIGAADVEVIRQTPSERRSTRVAVPAGVRFDAGEGLLRTWDMAATPRLEFDNFNLDAMAVEQVTIEAAPGAAPDPGGRITVIRKRYDDGQLRAVARLLLDRERQVVAFTQPMFGTSITTRTTDRETALRPHPFYRSFSNMMVPAPYRMSAAALQGHIRYRFTFRDGLDFTPPQTGEQRVTARPGALVLDICATCGPGLPSDAASLARALQPTAWLQSDHPHIRAIARPVAISRFSEARKMELLMERARPYLGEVDFAGHFSALEAINRRMGDCTEAAVVLAALGRAAGIPTRVVSGLVYSRQRYHGVTNAFMPHSWVVAFVDGRWRSYDLALDRFGSSHIALTVGDGDARAIMASIQLASLLRWEQMAEIRTRPTP